MTILNTKEFDERVPGSDRPVLVDFFATWCGPCKMQAPILEECAAAHPEMDFYKVDVDEAGELAQRYGIMSIPTLMLFKNGETKTSVGLMPLEELEEFIG